MSELRLNPSKKDQLYLAELLRISDRLFKTVRNKPTAIHLGFPYRGNRYDELIAGWVQYWNDVLAPDDPLDPNFVKALIATEFGFDPLAKVSAGKRAGYARGLLQLTDWTLEILSDEKGELRNHLVNLSQNDLYTPNLNIAAGVRWLFRKRETASAKLGRAATWLEAAADYKSYLEQWKKNSNHKQMKRLIQLYERIRE